MTSSQAIARGRIGRIGLMVGRDPRERGRVVTPLELLFDLAFVAAIGVAADQFAHLLTHGHPAEGVFGFGFAMFAISWAWIAFSWFASAFDTDDWFYRITTMVQMTGVIILALGLPVFFHSLEEGQPPANLVVVSGYVVMRVAIVVQWLRVARQDPEHRATAIGMSVTTLVIQLFWVALAIAALPLPLFIVIGVTLTVIELAAPRVIERRSGSTPWHPHHLAERYGLFAIIVLGEGVFGTIAAVNALVDVQGWSGDAIMVVVAGTALTFAMWWAYFTLPSGPVLARYRDRLVSWGYGHIVLYTSIAAVGAGLHAAAYFIEGESELSSLLTVVAVSLPVLVFVVALFVLHTALVGEGDPFHWGLFAGTIALLVLAVALAAAGVALSICLVVVTLAPILIVVGDETVGHRHRTELLSRVLS
ncbi:MULTISPECIES: low temperature requirement protein A [unclassified Microcella]|uniref:low temperature requirement protein A n=1 Tax=unclassified Microcella TaxID=2630066 RepID=UPI0007007E19|nr:MULTISPECIES: low temperature requirement protein A [unclassified Microcella]KQV26374.1 hypothetical protein ASC54_05640 [Yonghaparkia sp. Root332]KRF32843.1 hypothetical protein ASG83_02100 [Yonghaparkia sp. Soil809]